MRRTRWREHASDVAMAARRGQRRLRAGRDRAAERVHHRRTQLRRQRGRLVETARASPSRMKGHGYDAVGVSQQVGPMCPHQGAQRRRQCVASVVFEEVHDAAERAFVGADGPATVDRRWAASAAGASFVLLRDDPPGRERVAAPSTQRRCESWHGVPARQAHGAVRRTVEEGLADQTGGRQQDGQQRVEPGTGCTVQAGCSLTRRLERLKPEA